MEANTYLILRKKPCCPLKDIGTKKTIIAVLLQGTTKNCQMLSSLAFQKNERKERRVLKTTPLYLSHVIVFTTPYTARIMPSCHITNATLILCTLHILILSQCRICGTRIGYLLKYHPGSHFNQYNTLLVFAIL